MCCSFSDKKEDKKENKKVEKTTNVKMPDLVFGMDEPKKPDEKKLDFAFGDDSATKKDDKKKDKTPTKSDSGPDFSFGGGDKKEEKKSDSSGGFGFGGDDKKESNDFGFGGDDKKEKSEKTESHAKFQASSLDEKTLTETVSSWNAELQKDVEEFKTLADKVSKWDQTIFQNEEKLYSVNEKIKKVEKQQSDLNSQLKFIIQTQDGLEKILEENENRILKMYEESRKGGVDADREAIYKKAEEINDQLDQMTEQLQAMIKTLNLQYEETSGSENQIAEIVQVINSHLNTLQWIDINTNTLGQQIAKVKPQENTWM
jgi:nuclear pore complex protein Nup62